MVLLSLCVCFPPALGSAVPLGLLLILDAQQDLDRLADVANDDNEAHVLKFFVLFNQDLVVEVL